MTRFTNRDAEIVMTSLPTPPPISLREPPPRVKSQEELLAEMGVSRGMVDSVMDQFHHQLALAELFRARGETQFSLADVARWSIGHAKSDVERRYATVVARIAEAHPEAPVNQVYA